MGRYSDLTDEALDARIIKFRDAIEEIAVGGDVSVIAGEGRRMEVTRGNIGQAERILAELELEKQRRDPTYDATRCGRAISVGIFR